MPFLIMIAGLVAPRVVIAVLWFFTTWFTGVFETRGWPILGFLIVPLTVLWYSVVVNWFSGAWTWWQIGILVLTVFADLKTGDHARK